MNSPSKQDRADFRQYCQCITAAYIAAFFITKNWSNL